MKTAAEELLKIQRQQSFRHRRILQSAQGVEVKINDKAYVSFCSNDYLGLANHPDVCAEASKAISKYGLGSGASQLISGYTEAHLKLETQLADFFNHEKVVLFSSGYLANLGAVATFADRQSIIIADKLNHASLIDAAKYAGAKLKRYHHLDMEHADTLVNAERSKQLSLISDGVFSMEGSIAPISHLVNLKKRTGCRLIIDDAHGIGVLGKEGRGSLEHLNVLPKDIDLLIGTFGKAFGSSGAFVAGCEEDIELLIQKARTLIYTTAPPAALATATCASLNLIIKEPERRERLHKNISYFCQLAQTSNIPIQPSITAIQTIILGTNERAIEFSAELERRGFLVIAIRPPTVPENKARLRITLSSEHTFQQVEDLVQAITDISMELN